MPQTERGLFDQSWNNSIQAIVTKAGSEAKRSVQEAQQVYEPKNTNKHNNTYLLNYFELHIYRSTWENNIMTTWIKNEPESESPPVNITHPQAP